jgi:serine/threonine-protein kinase HipA
MDRIESATSVRRAAVYKSGVHAATLRRTSTGVVFAYLDGYDGPAIATTLPRDGRPRTSPAGAVPPFFSNLLPEGRRLTALRRHVKTSADDELSLLVAVGADPVGDVQIVPEGEPPDRPSAKLDIARWEDVRFADLLAEEGIDPVALAGVQPKVSAAMIALPVTTTGGHHLLKLTPPEFPHLVENEAFFLSAARRSGLRVAQAEVVRDRDGVSGLLVRRFDRRVVDGETVALAQEDGCQVLGRYPADKHTVTAEEVCTALVEVTRARPVAARDLFTQVVFAYLTGNGDLHAKNLSVGQTSDGEWRVTPAYDLPSSQPYGDTTSALDVQGRRREDITRRTMLAFAADIGLTGRAAASVLDRLVKTAALWLPDLDALPFDERRRHRLRRVIEDRRQKLAG